MYHTLLWAQQQAPDEAVIRAILIALGLAFVLSIAIGLAINIVICIMLHKCLLQIPAEHRKMEVWHIWLLMIPLFGLGWNFFVYLRLPESYQSYFAEQGQTDVGDCGRNLGMWYAICGVAILAPCVNTAAGPAALVLLIMFHVKTFELRKLMPQEAAR